MSSTLGCIGLAVDDVDVLDHLVGRRLPEAAVIAQAGDLQARRWTDPSGASITMTVRQEGEDGGVLVDLVPSYVVPDGAAGSEPGVVLGRLTGHGRTLAADLVDADGETLTRVACDLAQSLVADVTEPRPARVTALGVDVTVHEDDAAFAASDASTMGSPAPGEAAHKYAAGAVLSYGLFGDPDTAEPTAYVSGTVLGVTSHVTAELEQGFHAAQVATVGGTFTVCLAAAEHPQAPRPGSIVAGTCYLVLDVPGLW
ncbi:hypothetical protein [Nocardioides sp.]|uniref:hypothetical protein n=1 Tax=Nocardioides sp. TaxID=35761 RepID=UPI00321AA5D4